MENRRTSRNISFTLPMPRPVRSKPFMKSTKRNSGVFPIGVRRERSPGRHRTASGSRSSAIRTAGIRSEEHTSELQSRGHLVCRLLLEKKNKTVHYVFRVTRVNNV